MTSFLRKESKAHIDRTFFNSLGLGSMEQLLLSVKIWRRSPFVCLKKWQTLVYYFSFSVNVPCSLFPQALSWVCILRAKNFCDSFWVFQIWHERSENLFRSSIYWETHTERESDFNIGCIEPPPLISLKKKKKRERERDGRHHFRFLMRRGGQELSSYLCKDVAVMARKRCYITFSEKKKRRTTFCKHTNA